MRLCGRLWTSPEPRWPAIGEYRGCVLKRPGTAAPARRRIRMIMAGLARRGVVGGVGVAARIDGVVACRGVACSVPLSLRRFAVRAPGSFPGSGERWGGMRGDAVRSGQNERVFVCRHLRSCPESQKKPQYATCTPSASAPSSRNFLITATGIPMAGERCCQPSRRPSESAKFTGYFRSSKGRLTVARRR